LPHCGVKLEPGRDTHWTGSAPPFQAAPKPADAVAYDRDGRLGGQQATTRTRETVAIGREQIREGRVGFKARPFGSTTRYAPQHRNIPVYVLTVFQKGTWPVR
jgi:hypothetical protein